MIIWTAIFVLTMPAAMDGDSVRDATQEWGRQPFRIAHIAAPERDEVGHPEALAAMGALAEDAPWACHLAGRPSFDRQVVDCVTASGHDVACTMLETGTVMIDPRYPSTRLEDCLP